MEAFTIKDFTFYYPQRTEPALCGINLTVTQGEFVTICGKSGCGKSTLLRNLKPALAPHGKRSGELFYFGKPLDELDQKEQVQRIGFVLQNTESQIVTDKVWHELAFGLESLSYDTKTIRLRVAEMASFFGIQSWFGKDVSELSGGQKQLLNLASVMAMQPDVLILDEPTSQLDPIAASDFLETIKRINQEIGTTILLTEHRLEEVLPMADRAVVLDGGSVILDDIPRAVGSALAEKNHDMFLAMPSAMQIYAGLYDSFPGSQCPITVRDGRSWLSGLFDQEKAVEKMIQIPAGRAQTRPTGQECSDRKRKDRIPSIEMRDVWFKYGKNEPDVIKDLSVQIYPGQIHCIVGGNGTGKSTALSIISGMRAPYRGSVWIQGKPLKKYANRELFQGILGVLPQDPQALFVENTVERDLLEILEESRLGEAEKLQKVMAAARLVGIEPLLKMHPYDLSGGEQQRAALAKVLLLEPRILLLDEPTKGIDPYFKRQLAEILLSLRETGTTIVMVSHDIEFCAKYGDLCSLFFDGSIITTNTPSAFFSGNSFYTTAANRMSRHLFQNAVTVKDVIDLCKQNLQTKESN